MGRWDEDDFYIGRISALFQDLDEQRKKVICDVAEQMVIDLKRKSDSNDLHIGDTIKCSMDEIVDVMGELEKEGYTTDFLYEKDGQKVIG